MRHDDAVDLGAAIASISAAVTMPALHVDVDRDLALTDAAVAQTALRALQEIVTNAVRHSGARNLWLRVALKDGALAIDARDDGDGMRSRRLRQRPARHARAGGVAKRLAGSRQRRAAADSRCSA